ncbi:hypothetical protein [Allosphingosinicella sp.]|jgi:hypothetical protein|uniref:hypothetical protein n=1 Tax=Allosphingosinicella sp. TaxID=2823234 RepID=UPI002F1DAB2A
MSCGAQLSLEEAFDQIEESLLPSISLLLDSLLDAAASARAGIDAHVHAAELRTLACHVQDLTRRIETFALPPIHLPARLSMPA